ESVIRSVAWFFFFFQAEDGIRDFHVTGVQTCALPISALSSGEFSAATACVGAGALDGATATDGAATGGVATGGVATGGAAALGEIGRASCRERGLLAGVVAACIQQLGTSEESTYRHAV